VKMSTSLKVQCANEIAEAMAEALGSDFVKTAAGPALEAYKADLAKAMDEDALKELWNKHMDALNQEESTDEALKLQAVKASELGIPGYATPMADDMQEADCEKCEFCGQEVPKKEEKPESLPSGGEPLEPMAWDAQTTVAADFAIQHLVKVADALDGKGFTAVANLVDEALEKLAKGKYKTWKGKGEKPPKGAEHKAPKGWWDEQAEGIKKKNPDYSKKRVSEIVGDIWDNQLSDAKREKIYKRYGKTKNPNK
jgi:hypothetical protein